MQITTVHSTPNQIYNNTDRKIYNSPLHSSISSVSIMQITTVHSYTVHTKYTIIQIERYTTLH